MSLVASSSFSELLSLLRKLLGQIDNSVKSILCTEIRCDRCVIVDFVVGWWGHSSHLCSFNLPSLLDTTMNTRSVQNIEQKTISRKHLSLATGEHLYIKQLQTNNLFGTVIIHNQVDLNYGLIRLDPQQFKLFVIHLNDPMAI